FSAERCISEGKQAGQLIGWSQKALRQSAIQVSECVPAQVLPGRKGWRKPAFVDFQNDVTSRDIEVAHAEGFESVEHLKRYTTTGMAADQGKTSNLNALTLLGQLSDRHPATVGTTTFRSPY